MIDKLINQGQYSEPLKKVLDLFAHGVVSPITLKETLKPYDTSLDDLHVEAIDAVIDFVNMILCDHVLTKEEMNMLRRLKAFLHIKEGDFIKAQKENEIKKMLCKEFELIYSDKVVDRNEAAMKVDLQELFGLSYDQFLSFEQEAVEYALRQGADISNLDTFYRL